MASHNSKRHNNNILNLSLAAKSTAALLLTICDPLTEFALVPEICLESSSSANANNVDQTQQQNNNNSDVPLPVNEQSQQQQSVLLPFKIHEALSYSRYGINSQRVPDASASHYAWNFLLKYAVTFGDRSVVIGKNRKQKDSKNNNNDENENILMKELENFLLMNTADEDIHIYELFGLAVVGTNEKENVVKNTTSVASKTQPQQPQRREREETSEKSKDKQQPAATMASLPPLNDNQRKLALVIQQLALATACILLGYKSRGTLHHIYPIARALFPRVIKIIVSLFPCPPSSSNNNNSQAQQQQQESNSNSSPASSKKKVSFNFETSNDVDGDNEDESQKVKENPEKDLASLFLSSTTTVINGNSNSERKPSSKHKSSSSSQQQQLPHQLAIARYYDRCIIVYEIILMQLFSSQSCQLTPTPFAMIRSSLVELVVGFTRLSHYPPRMIQNPLARQFGLVSYVFRTHDELPFTMVRLVDSRVVVEEKKKKIDQEFEIANQRNESYYLSILKKKKKKKAMMMNTADVDFNEDDYDDDEDESNNDAIANNNVGIGLMSLLPSLHDDVPLPATSSSTTAKSQINNLASISLLDKLPNLTDDDANVMMENKNNNNSNADVFALLPSLSSQDTSNSNNNNNNHSTSAAGGFRMVPVWKQTQNQSNGDNNNITTTTLSQNSERNNNNNIPPLQQDIQVSSGSMIPIASSQPPISFATAPQQQQLPALIVNDNNKEGGGDDDDDDWFENDVNNPTSIKSCAPLASLVEQMAMKNNNLLAASPPAASLTQQQLLLPQHAGIVTLTMPDIQKGGINNNSQQSQIVPLPSAEIWWSGAENNNNNIDSQGRTSTSFFVDSTADQQADLLFLKPEEKQQRQALLMEEKRKKEVCGAINVQKMLRSVSSLYDLPTRSGTAATTINPATANASGNNNNFEEAQQTLERWSKKAMRLLSPWGDLVRRVSARDYYEFMHQQQQQPQQQQNEDSAQNNNTNNVKPKLQYFNQFPTFQANTQMMDLLKISNEKVHSWLDRWSGAGGCRRNKNESSSSSSSSSLEFFSVPFSAVITRLALLASIVADFAVEKKCDMISPLFPQVEKENRYSLNIDSAIQQTENDDDNKQLPSYLDDSLFSQISSVSSSYQVIFEALTYFSGNHPPEIATVNADQQHNKNNIKRNNINNNSNLSDQRQQTREIEILKAYFNISDAVELRRYILHLAHELILAEKSDIEAEREKIRAVEEKRQQMSYHYFDDLMGFGSNIDNNEIHVSSHNNNNANYFYDATSSMETTMRMHQQPQQDGDDEMNNSFNQNSNVEQHLYGEASGTGGQVNFLTQEQVFGSL